MIEKSKVMMDDGGDKGGFWDFDFFKSQISKKRVCGEKNSLELPHRSSTKKQNLEKLRNTSPNNLFTPPYYVGSISRARYRSTEASMGNLVWLGGRKSDAALRWLWGAVCRNPCKTSPVSVGETFTGNAKQRVTSQWDVVCKWRPMRRPSAWL